MKKISLVIVCLNLIYMAFAAYTLYEDYRTVGEFQWVHPDAIAQDEESYSNITCGAILFLGFAVMANQVVRRWNSKSHSWYMKAIKNFSAAISLIYGSFAVVFCLLILYILLTTIEDIQGKWGYLSLFLLFSVGFGCLGSLLVLQRIGERLGKNSNAAQMDIKLP